MFFSDIEGLLGLSVKRKGLPTVDQLKPRRGADNYAYDPELGCVVQVTYTPETGDLYPHHEYTREERRKMVEEYRSASASEKERG